MGKRIAAIGFISSSALQSPGPFSPAPSFTVPIRLIHSFAAKWRRRAHHRSSVRRRPRMWRVHGARFRPLTMAKKLCERSTALHPPDERAAVNVALHADYRRKGFLWYSTYQVQFAGAYEFVNPDDRPRNVTFTLHLPAEQAIYDDMVFTVNGAPLVLENQKSETYGSTTVLPHQTAVLNVGYRSQGLDTWQYSFGDQVSQVRDFELRLTTDFKGFDFPGNTLSPTQENRSGRGSELVWSYKNLVSGLQNWPCAAAKIAARSARWTNQCLRSRIAAVFLFRAVRSHHDPRHQPASDELFLPAVSPADGLSGGPRFTFAFAICSAVSVILPVSYLRLVVGMRFAAVEAGLAQVTYLILFSYAFFFEGFTGLAITIGAILTLFITMQMTARVRWSEKFATGPVLG